MKRFLSFLFGGLLLAGSVFGVAHATRAGIAQTMYRMTKWRPESETFDMKEAARRYEDARGFYPFNYYFCIWTAEKAYHTWRDEPGRDRKACTDLSEKWCDAGLALNSRNSQLQFLKTRLIAERSLEDAVVFFEKYLEWNFWQPKNHALLAELYAAAGEIEKAYASLEWIEQTPEGVAVREKIRAAWRKELEQLPR